MGMNKPEAQVVRFGAEDVIATSGLYTYQFFGFNSDKSYADLEVETFKDNVSQGKVFMMNGMEASDGWRNIVNPDKKTINALSEFTIDNETVQRLVILEGKGKLSQDWVTKFNDNYFTFDGKNFSVHTN